MAKKLSDIRELINSKEEGFKDYLENNLDKKVWTFIKKLSQKFNVYFFSGIIRDYFLNFSNFRDVDLVIEGEVDITKVIKNLNYKKNSFGGYKIYLADTTIDLWFLRDTWAIKRHQITLDFDLSKYIPRTAFFNFSAIIFSFNENRFFYTIYFLRFLRDRKIDLVFKPNANYALCVVNSFYYSDKLNLKLTDTLKKHLRKLNNSNAENYESSQLKHFGKILYAKDELEKRIAALF